MPLRVRFLIIAVITLLAAIIAMPASFTLDFNRFHLDRQVTITRPQLNLHLGQFSFSRDLNLHYGLDIAGGTRVLLEVDMQNIDPQDYQTALNSAREVIARRVDLFGVSEPTIYTLESQDTHQIVVELPGLKDPTSALQLIGSTAQLEFRSPVYYTPTQPPDGEEATQSAEPQLVDFQATDLTGQDLKRASVTFETQDRQPAVSLEFNAEGTQKFADLTKEFLDKPIAIYLDSGIVTAPVVQSEITDGHAIISGNFTTDEAQQLAIQLNAGALPAPIHIISQNTISPTLGASSISQSFRAGIIGLLIVILFMISFYGWLGVYASIGLFIYGLITLSLYKLIPITLTLPGIAGFLLSVGMAVDSNILIFERYKEELAIRPSPAALELAFGRAWDSIKDANITTLITAFILFNPLNWTFLPTSGLVRGFALTLALGIAISLFTGIFVTRTLLRIFYKPKPKKS